MFIELRKNIKIALDNMERCINRLEGTAGQEWEQLRAQAMTYDMEAQALLAQLHLSLQVAEEVLHASTNG